MIPILTLLLLSQNSPFSKPAALIALEQSRKAFRTADIRWREEYHRRSERGLAKNHRLRVAGDDFIYEHLGDDDGILSRSADGLPVVASPFKFLSNSDGVLEHVEGRVFAKLHKERSTSQLDRYMQDPRLIGVFPWMWKRGVTLEKGYVQHLAAGRAPLRFSQEDEGDKVRVTGRTESGASISWLIDPAKSWNAERIEWRDSDGNVTAEVLVELDRFGSVWFPRSVKSYQGGILNHTVEVLEASFDSDDHPSGLTPADMGIEPGMTISVVGETKPDKRHMMYDDSGRLVTIAEFTRRLEAGELQYGPFMAAAYAAGHVKDRAEKLRHRMIALRPLFYESAWVRYTREFIRKYGLNDEQSQHAWKICKQSQDRGREYVTRHKSRVEALTRRIETSQAEPETQQAQDKLKELLEPLAEIFEKRLKPGLDAIPTRKQKARADGIPTEQKRSRP